MQCITSMLGFCDEVVICDAGSTDGTWEALKELAATNDKIIIYQHKRNFDDLRFAVYDGQQKALARSLCTKEFCWQMDSDEVIHEKDYRKVRDLIKNMPSSVELLALPVIEYWGQQERVRVDVNPWKWRVSRNRPHITHGIPKGLRKYDTEGSLYSAQGSDGCDYIRFDSYDQIPLHSFYTSDAHNARIAALSGDMNALQTYGQWFKDAVNALPVIHHFSWWNIERKIHTYKNYWSRHWESLYDIKQEDTPENNKFFDVAWTDVTDEMVTSKAKELSENTGGWVFHTKWNGQGVPSINLCEPLPSVMEGWCKENG